MVSGERSVVSIYRCIRANYCTNDEKDLEAVHEEKPKGSELCELCHLFDFIIT
jgi:hypothetical protein